jgi:misacylated tRNA(Ala) deacylase
VTEDLASRDAYATSTEAIVVERHPEGVVLDRTVFHARGGGQPGDVGVLRWVQGGCDVLDTIRTSGRTVHVVEPGREPRVGERVGAEIDWVRRYVLMRTHTALHALSGVVFRGFGAKVTGGNMEPGIARMDFELDGISQEFGRQVERTLNEALVKDLLVRVSFLPRADALADPDLIRTKVSLIPEDVDPIRVVDIEGLDRQADGGTHVRSTAEVGALRVVKTESKGKANKRMRIELVDR